MFNVTNPISNNLKVFVCLSISINIQHIVRVHFGRSWAQTLNYHELISTYIKIFNGTFGARIQPTLKKKLDKCCLGFRWNTSQKLLANFLESLVLFQTWLYISTRSRYLVILNLVGILIAIWTTVSITYQFLSEGASSDR